MELKVKIWLVGADGKGFLGGGRFRLLREIHRQGSLRKAADALGISYRKAWGDVRAIERELGFDLLHRRRGGCGGGASELTDKGQKLLDAFGRILTEMETEAKKQFKKHLDYLSEPD
ncbi:MAG: LysR family transcriptional regulator [Sedimentisphaerales bacterium]|nr:LysR family transcriptional regulator [Sedimentisphaerales bacterium]